MQSNTKPRIFSAASWAALLTFLLALGCTPADVTEALGESVVVAQGELTGTRLGSGILTFRGIPYAAPPVGDLRWRPPQQASSWEGARDASEFSAACWQPDSVPNGFYDTGPIDRSEDCLYLNVWTGAESADAALPVMVWIHGGGLVTGTGSTVLYDGEELASRGVVLVTINYRLGPLGFLAHPELTAENDPPTSGNYGVMDQAAALGWVQDNIASFGGDPSRVTIFGESAGSWSVNFMTATPLAAGTFQRAIGHSGGIFWPMLPLSGEGSAEELGVAFGESHAAATAAELRALAPEVVSAGGAVMTQANVDGYVFPKEIHAIFAAGEQNDVDTIVGFNSDEGTALFSPAVPSDVVGYRGWLEATYPGHADAFEAVYPAATDEDANRAGFENMADNFFAWQMRKWAQLQSETGTKPVRKYYFSRVPPWSEAETYGSYHAAEIIYAFNNLHKSGELRDDVGPFNHAWDDTDRALAQTMSSYWINFATTGDPNGEGLPEWPLYDAATDRALELGDEVGVAEGVLDDQLDAFDAYYESLRAGG